MSRLALVDWVSANGAIAPRTKLNKNRQAFMRKAKIVDTIGPATEDPWTGLTEASSKLVWTSLV